MRNAILILLVAATAAWGQSGGFMGVFRGAAAEQARPKGGGGGSFTYHATGFNGSSYVYGNDLNISDGKRGAFSLWVKFNAAGDGTAQDLIGAADTAVTRTVFKVQRLANNTIQVRALSSANAEVLNIATAGPITSAQGWVHLCASWDMANGSSYFIYTNGVSAGATASTYSDSNISWGTGDPLFAVGGYAPDAHPLNGALSEMWFADRLITTTDVADFRDGTHPKNLGSDGSGPDGTAAVIYLPNAYGSFGVNPGSAGDFPSTQGTLADGDADKP